jgi:folate-binding protein YgfZ
MVDVADAYRAIAEAAGFIDRSERARLRITGPDRVKFLHNLTTNDVKRLAVGRGQECFVTDPKGKTLGYATLLACEDWIELRTDPAGLRALWNHLEKYGVFDEIALEDASAQSYEYHVAGSEAEAVLKHLGAALPDLGDLSHRTTEIAGQSVRIVRETPTGRPGLTLIGAAVGAAEVRSRLHSAAGLVDIPPDVFETLRIEAGTPVFDRDVTADNLPQEIGRDARAISFVKGCYLGQETVARIDAIGHVNRFLKGLKMREPDSPPPPGSSVRADGKAVGSITSSAFSPGWRVGVALAILRASHANAGTEVEVDTPVGARTAIVMDLPMLPGKSTD